METAAIQRSALDTDAAKAATFQNGRSQNCSSRIFANFSVLVETSLAFLTIRSFADIQTANQTLILFYDPHASTVLIEKASRRRFQRRDDSFDLGAWIYLLVLQSSSREFHNDFFIYNKFINQYIKAAWISS